MRSVTVFAEQAETNTRHRVDQATRQAASAVMTEAELRHTAATADVHAHYQRMVNAIQPQHQQQMVAIRETAAEEVRQAAARTASQYGAAYRQAASVANEQNEASFRQADEAANQVNHLQAQLQELRNVSSQVQQMQSQLQN